MLWGEVTQAKLDGTGSWGVGPGLPRMPWPRDRLSGAAALSRSGGGKRETPDAKVGGDASRKRKAPRRGPTWESAEEFRWAGQGEQGCRPHQRRGLPHDGDNDSHGMSEPRQGPVFGGGRPAGLFPWDRLVRAERGARGCAHFPGAGRAAPRRSARGRAGVCWPPASRSSTASEHPPGTCRTLFTCELVSRASERHSLTTTSPAAGFLIWECVCVWPI